MPSRRRLRPHNTPDKSSIQVEITQERPKRKIASVTDVSASDSVVSLASPSQIQAPVNWPPSLPYLPRPIISVYLSENQRRWVNRKPRTQQEDTAKIDHEALPVIKLPLPRSAIDGKIEIKVIDNKDHPAHGQRGLFAVRDLAPEELVVPYIGYVHSSTSSERAVQQQLLSSVTRNLDDADGLSLVERRDDGAFLSGPSTPDIGSWDSSSYDLNLYRDDDVELAIDAGQMGNEARFCNDYRGVPASSPVSDRQSMWDRKSKRAAKGWQTKSNDAVQEDKRKWSITNGDTAIPNSEFRDVWFECQPEQTEMHMIGETGAGGLLVNESRSESIINVSANNQTGMNQSRTSPRSDHLESNSTHTRQHGRRKKSGMRGVAIFVLPAGKSGKRKHGIRAGQEILVSYGKAFWAHHNPPWGNADDNHSPHPRKEDYTAPKHP